MELEDEPAFFCSQAIKVSSVNVSGSSAPLDGTGVELATGVDSSTAEVAAAAEVVVAAAVVVTAAAVVVGWVVPVAVVALGAEAGGVPEPEPPVHKAGPGMGYAVTPLFMLKIMPSSSALYKLVPTTPSGFSVPEPVTSMLRHCG